MEEEQNAAVNRENEETDAEKIKFMNRINAKVKHISVAIKVFGGVWLVVLVALVVLMIFDNATPTVVYLIALIIWSGVAPLAGFLTQRYLKKLQRKTENYFNLPEDSLTGGKTTDKQLIKQNEKDETVKKSRDAVYWVLLSFAIVGDVAVVLSLAFVAASLPAKEATVILFLVGAGLAVIFHIAALIRRLRNKSKLKNHELK